MGFVDLYNFEEGGYVDKYSTLGVQKFGQPGEKEVSVKMGNLTAEAEQIIERANHLKAAAEKQAGIDSEKVQRTVSDYMRIARDRQLNYIELLQVFADMKETVIQSLNTLPLSASVATYDDTANV